MKKNNRSSKYIYLITFIFFNFSTAVFSQDSFINRLGMKMLKIKAGCFMMGSNPDNALAPNKEIPKHLVCITQDYYLSETEITQFQWQVLMGNNPSRFKGRTHPVENVSYQVIQKFIKKLNELEGTKKYRLPTEAEWEYAARATSQTEYHFGNKVSQLKDYAWYQENSDDITHPVKFKRPNQWGLYDMHGNVWEWVDDWYKEKYYIKSPKSDPTGPNTGQYRVIRGGSYYSNPKHLRSASRNDYIPNYHIHTIGFRLLMITKEKS